LRLQFGMGYLIPQSSALAGGTAEELTAEELTAEELTAEELTDEMMGAVGRRPRRR
jgi:hypothetical protein